MVALAALAIILAAATASGQPTLQYAWTMDTDPGWTYDALWAFGQPTGQGGQYGVALAIWDCVLRFFCWLIQAVHFGCASCEFSKMVELVESEWSGVFGVFDIYDSWRVVFVVLCPGNS